MKRLTLTAADIQKIQGLLAETTKSHTSVTDSQFLNQAGAIAAELPRCVRNFINDFRFSEPSDGAAIISGYPVDDSRIGKTPEHWKSNREISPTLFEDMLLILYGSLLGDVFCWGTEQGGHIIQEVIPIKSHRLSQMSTGSEQQIWWHTEDAFHPYTSDYVGLMCLRNPERVATTFACVDQFELDPKIVEILFQSRFVIRPVESHQETNNQEVVATGSAEGTYQRIREMNSNPTKISVFYGHPGRPYLRIDPYFMDSPDDPQDRHALEELVKTAEANLKEVFLEPGDCCLIDNYKAVHGRRPFAGRYDGTDRWLKRVNITRDLRKSRCSREHANSRIIL
jgi:Fe(II)/alpha-ketoglutarate-dependent arginine beta-hydroxylase